MMTINYLYEFFVMYYGLIRMNVSATRFPTNFTWTIKMSAMSDDIDDDDGEDNIKCLHGDNRGDEKLNESNYGDNDILSRTSPFN